MVVYHARAKLVVRTGSRGRPALNGVPVSFGSLELDSTLIVGISRTKTVARVVIDAMQLVPHATDNMPWTVRLKPMNDQNVLLDRRSFLGQIALGAATFSAASLWTPGVFAEELMKTPRDDEGPFYPDKMPLDTDNDLLIINDKITPAVGKITHLGGRVLDIKGNPIRGALVEIWQCDGNGVYLHTRAGGKDKIDKNFQGFGRFLTGRTGEYYFRTIRPVPYTGRTPHVHMIVKKGKDRLLTTQLYDREHPKRNANDFLYKRVPQKSRHLITIGYDKMKQSKIGETVARVDIVVGLTPEDPKHARDA